jgi:hypothetical protein
MKSIRILLYSFAITSLFFISCETDDPISESDPRNNYLGVWTVSEECNRMSYDVNVAYDPGNSSQVLITNFANPGPGYPPVRALVVGEKLIVQQQITGDNWQVSGDGTYDDDKDIINWTYNLTIGGNYLTCTAIYSR